MQARLKVLHNKANVKQVKLLPVTLIGRSTECNLKIASSQVSRTHCRITLGEDTVYVEDLGSANGTTVDGKPLEAHKPQAVVPGATLVVGPASFLIDYVASTSATLVLSRFDVPISPSLSSTELLIPARKEAVERLATPVAAPIATAFPVAKPVGAAQGIAIAVAAAIPVADPPTVVPNPLLPESVSSQDEASVEMSFAGFSSPPDEPAEVDASPFSFIQPEAGDSASPFSVQPTASSSSKKGAGKSIFSIFGRKAKGSVSTPTPATAPVVPSKAPSVFLPTMDRMEADAAPVEADAEPIEFRFGEQSDSDAALGTVTFEEIPSATPSPSAAPEPSAPSDLDGHTMLPADDEDGFQQFLKQL